MTTGPTTFLDFPEGTGCPFIIGEAVSLTVDGQSALDFEHKFIINVLTSSNVGGYFSTRVEIDHDTSSGTDAFDALFRHTQKVNQSVPRPHQGLALFIFNKSKFLEV